MKPAETFRTTAISILPYRPHDLLWVDGFDALISREALPTWVKEQWHSDLPVVVRRDQSEKGLIPAGIRGKYRHERAAVWIPPDTILKKRSPETLIKNREQLMASPFFNAKPVCAILELMEMKLPFVWGVTGSVAYALATGCAVIHENSDLDLLIRCNEPVLPEQFALLIKKCTHLPCRTDIQIETPAGAFALKEWIRQKGKKVLLKTNTGPVLTADLWRENGKKP